MADERKINHRERLRQRFCAGEKSSFEEEALLELLLIYAIPRKDVQPIAKQLLKKFGNLSNVLESDINTLCEFKTLDSVPV